MGVDLLRSCYRTKMRLFADSDQEVNIRWFWVPPHAEVYPGYHPYGSGNWASSKEGWTGPGEVSGVPRTWYNGKTPRGFHGKKICGDPDKLAAGYSVNDKRICTDVTGLSSCCTEPREFWCCDFPPPDLPEVTTFTVTEIVNKSPDTLVNAGDVLTFYFQPSPFIKIFTSIDPLFPITSPYANTVMSLICSGYAWTLYMGRDGQFVGGGPTNFQLPYPFFGNIPSFQPFFTIPTSAQDEVWRGYFGDLIEWGPTDAGVMPEPWFPIGYQPGGFL
jgi:hypothetical protein